MDVSAVEQACERLYTAQDAAQRASAEEALAPFRGGVASIGPCKALLDASSSPYARHLASASLLKTITETNLDVPVRAEMRSYFLSYLCTQAPTLQPFVAASLCQLLARLVKLGWYDDEAFRSLADDARAALDAARARGDRAGYALMLRLLGALVAEFNAPSPGRTLTQHRRAAVSFRDAALFPIFTAGLDELRRLGPGSSEDGGGGGAGGGMPALSTSPSSSSAQLLLASGGNLKDGGDADAGGPDAKLREAALSLVLACLSFDFVGTCLDESADDLGTIQVPTPWRAAVEPPETPVLFFRLYAACPRPPLSSLALECLVRLASVRRSLFGTDAARARFLGALVAGSAALLRARAGLEQHANYHELCRLLCRLKTNYQLSELVAAEGYAEWIALVADFTVSSLRAWAWAQGSVFYLLGLWSRLVTSVPYLKGDAPCRLDAHVPQIVAAYVHSRLEAARTAAAADGGDADPIANGDGGGNGGKRRSSGNGGDGGNGGGDDDEFDGGSAEALAEQLDALPHLARFDYRSSAELLAAAFDPLAAAAAAAAAAPATTAPPTPQARAEAAAVEGQLAWLVHIIAAVVRGRLTASASAASSEASEAIDGDLAARVFALAAALDGRPVSGGGGGTGRESSTSGGGGGNDANGNNETSTTGGDGSATSAALASAAAAANDPSIPPPPLPPPPPPHSLQRARERSRQRLELALLSFFSAFRKVYVGEQVVHSSKVYSRLQERLHGLGDHAAVLDAMMSKVASNLVTYGGDGSGGAGGGAPGAAAGSSAGSAPPSPSLSALSLASPSGGSAAAAAAANPLLLSSPMMMTISPTYAPDVMAATLDLFADLSAGYMSGKLVLALPTTRALLARHSPEALPFLRAPALSTAAATTPTAATPARGPASARHRTAFYATLAKLLFMDDSPARFRAFVAPLQATLAAMAASAGAAGAPGTPTAVAAGAAAAAAAALASPRHHHHHHQHHELPPLNPAALAASVSPELASGVFRDLRGLLSSASSRRAYQLCFDWLHPNHSRALLAALAAWAPAPLVSVPALKFYGELALNKAQRLAFDGSSPNGILLFRELSKAVVTYGRALLSQMASEGGGGAGGLGAGAGMANGGGGSNGALTNGNGSHHHSSANLATGSSSSKGPSSSKIYEERYKGIAAALVALTRALGGGYVNFAVFDLYGDAALSDALDVGLALALAPPLRDVLAYRKLARAYFAFVDVLAHGHAGALAARDGATFAAVVASLDAGLRSVDVSVSSQCAAAVDNLAATYFKGCAAAAAAQDAAQAAQALAAQAAAGAAQAQAQLQQAVAAAAQGGAAGDPLQQQQLQHHLHQQQQAAQAAAAAAAAAAADAAPPPRAAAALAAHAAARPDLFPGLLATLFEVALFEEAANQWSLSRPMLSLILVNEAVYDRVRQAAVEAHSPDQPDRRPLLAAALGKLMTGVARSLEPKNRDKFTQNLTLVRHEIRAKAT